MHDIEPWHGWRDEYTAENDKKSPFHGCVYDEFNFSNKIYNYYIHPQWDYFGSETLYGKLLFVNYTKHFAVIELIGEWNDALYNDIMFLKRQLADILNKNKIYRFTIICENVLNFHGDDDCYYEEWYDDIRDDRGWICLINTFDHVSSEMSKYRLHHYINFGSKYNNLPWRTIKPDLLLDMVENIMNNQTKALL